MGVESLLIEFFYDWTCQNLNFFPDWRPAPKGSLLGAHIWELPSGAPKFWKNVSSWELPLGSFFRVSKCVTREVDVFQKMINAIVMVNDIEIDAIEAIMVE